VLPYRGSGTWRVDGAPFANPLGESVLFLPPAPLSENNVTSGVAINIAPAQPMRTAVAMAGPEGAGSQLARAQQEPRRLLPADHHCPPLIDSIYRTIASVDQLMASAEAALPLLRLDDLLIHLTLLLLVPRLGGAPRTAPRALPPAKTPS
jgi:hypothetical protein